MLARLAAACLLAAAVSPARADEPAHSHAGAPSMSKAPMFDLGKWHHGITTSSPEAQRYFDQGLNLAYGFNHLQASAAFAEAARLDSSCAMAYWGMALVLGPNINMPMDSTAERPAWEAVQKAVSLASTTSEGERAYIEALAKRYGDPKDAMRPSRAVMDSAYANAMREVWKRHPNDADAGTLFAEAMLDLSPWNQWELDGKALPGTEEVVATLEAVLKMAPECPGANHYYIHAVEASQHPERAVPAAERLGTMVPDAGHLVHMPGHIWNRVGRYARSEDANVRAARVDSIYVATYKPEGLYPMMYYPHNVHFIWSSSCFEGRSDVAIQAARRLETLWSVATIQLMPPAEFICPTTLYTFVRFGRWADILAQPAPPAELRFTTAMWHYARGLAFAATRQLPSAIAERESLASIAATIPAETVIGFNSAGAILSLAHHVLAGEIAAKQGKTLEAVKALTDGVNEEDALHYDEPPDWYLPVRQNLGAVLLAAGRTAEAATVYREDLRRFPENGWSLFGLAKCLRARKATAEAAAVEKRLAKAWARADVKLTASRF